MTNLVFGIALAISFKKPLYFIIYAESALLTHPQLSQNTPPSNHLAPMSHPRSLSIPSGPSSSGNGDSGALMCALLRLRKLMGVPFYNEWKKRTREENNGEPPRLDHATAMLEFCDDYGEEEFQQMVRDVYGGVVDGNKEGGGRREDVSRAFEAGSGVSEVGGDF